MQHPAESGRFYVKLYNAMLYYIVNLIAFNLLVNNKLITQFIIAFTFVNMSKISFVCPLLSGEGKDSSHLRGVGSGPQNVENNGFEPLTPCLQSRCSSQLS